MTAILFHDVLRAVESKALASPDVRACVESLRAATPDASAAPTLAALQSKARDSATLGARVLAVLACPRLGVVESGARVLDPRWPRGEEGRRKAVDLYADAYLVLGDWVAAWNRRQIRLV